MQKTPHINPAEAVGRIRAGSCGMKMLVLLLLALAVAAGGCTGKSLSSAPHKKIDWGTVTPEEVEAMIETGDLDVNQLHEGVGGDDVMLSTIMAVVFNGGNPNILNVLVKHGADIDYYLSTANFNLTALDFAVRRGREKMAQRLLELGASIGNGHDKKRIPTLNHAVEKSGIDTDKRKAMIDLLLAHGADVDALDRTGEEFTTVFTPLMGAILHGGRDLEHQEGYIEIIHHLISRGADIHITPKNSSITPMGAAAIGKNAVILKELIALGGNVNALSADHKGCHLSPLSTFAMFGGSMEVFDALIAAGADLDKKEESCPSVIGWLDIRKSGKMELSPVVVPRALNFNSHEEWERFTGKIRARIKALCEERTYDVCLELEKKEVQLS